jgi:hypothetical protein
MDNRKQTQNMNTNLNMHDIMLKSYCHYLLMRQLYNMV